LITLDILYLSHRQHELNGYIRSPDTQVGSGALKGISLQVYVEEGADVVRSYSDLAAAIEGHKAQRA
jgi:hypothetical protein